MYTLTREARLKLSLGSWNILTGTDQREGRLLRKQRSPPKDRDISAKDLPGDELDCCFLLDIPAVSFDNPVVLGVRLHLLGETRELTSLSEITCRKKRPSLYSTDFA